MGSVEKVHSKNKLYTSSFSLPGIQANTGKLRKILIFFSCGEYLQ